MKVLHVAYTRNPSGGIIKQMEVEQRAASELQLPWSTKLFLPIESDSPVAVTSTTNPDDRVRYKTEFYEWIESEIDNFDVLLLRNSKLDPFQWKFLRKFPKPVFLVHHTLEGHQFHSEGRRFPEAQIWLDNFLMRRCFKHCEGIISVTDEIAQYELGRSHCSHLKSMIYPNGIYLNEEPPVGNLKILNSCPEFVFLASQFLDWHGFDVVVEALIKSQYTFRLHLIGQLTPDQLKLIENDPRFHAHGLLKENQIDQITKKCIIGLGSFALFRKNMHEVCSLKVRDYLSKGLPVYAGDKDVFDETMPFYKYEIFDVDALIQYAADLNNTPRADVYAAAGDWIDKKILITSLYNKLKTYYGN